MLPDAQPGRLERGRRRSGEGRSADAEPERDAADVSAAREPDEPRQVAVGRRGRDRGGEIEAARHGDGGRDGDRGARRGTAPARPRRPTTPAPPPASARFTWTGTLAPGRTSPKETEAGDASTSGTSALSGFASPPPARIGVAALAPVLDGAAGLDQRCLEIGHRPGGMPLEQQGGGAGDLRRRHRRPRHRLPVAAGHRGQDRDAGGADVGLEPQRQRCRAGGAEVGERAAARRIGARDGGDGDRPVGRCRARSAIRRRTPRSRSPPPRPARPRPPRQRRARVRRCRATARSPARRARG